MDIYDDDEDDISLKIKHFLTKDTNFRDPQFDPAPYLIKVLKEKEANQELLVEKQAQLIQLENQAQQLIQEVAIEKCDQFLGLLSIPQQYGEQLEKLKQNMANVKRKVKETKSLLQLTQKDIQQIHLNCVFNKLIYKRLKEVQLKLNQYQTAALALKNHLYLDCAQNLPIFNSSTVLQNTLAARSENLKLKFLHQAIQQVRLFLYFTPRLAMPSTHCFLDRAQDREQVFNEEMHQHFRKRYLLFKKAKSQQYLSSIWALDGLQQKSGRVAIIHDIVKGIIRIGKSTEITQSLSLDAKKSVSNIYQVLLYFFAKQAPQAKQIKTKKWFTSPQTVVHTTFLSVLFCVGAALLRKTIIVRRICSEYQLQEVTTRLSSEKVLEMIRDQILNLTEGIYFPEINALGLDIMQQELVGRLRAQSNFALWPYFKKMIESCLQILTQQLAQVESKFFSMTFPMAQFYIKPFLSFHKKFLQLFHRQYLKTLEQIFPQGRGFNLESVDSISFQRQYEESELQFCQKYCSEDRKSIRQFINLISFLNSLRVYFSSNSFEQQKYKLYSVFLLAYFYLKLNCTIFRYIISPTQYDKIISVRNKDGKIKNKEKHLESKYQCIIAPRTDLKIKEKKHLKHQQGDHPQLRNIEQLKMIRSLSEMVLFYVSHHFSYLQPLTTSAGVEKFEKELEKHEPSNYDENVGSKLIRVWQQLLKPLEEVQNLIDCLTCAIFKKWFELKLTINACLYIETGVY